MQTPNHQGYLYLGMNFDLVPQIYWALLIYSFFLAKNFSNPNKIVQHHNKILLNFEFFLKLLFYRKF